MKKENWIKKQKLAGALGMEFDEVSSILSEETLSSMMMTHIIGGEDTTHTNCENAKCGNCVPQCQCNCETKSGTAGCNDVKAAGCNTVSVSVSVSVNTKK